MGVADELEGLPAGVGHPLADICRKLEKAQPQGLRDVGQNWKTAADNVNNHAQGINGAVSGINGAWEGASADAFAGYCKTFVGVFNTMHDELQTAAGALESAASALESAKSTVERIGGDTVDQCKPYLVPTPNEGPDGPAHRLEMMRGIVGNGVKDAEPHLNEADKALADAAGKVGNALDFVGPRQGAFSFNQVAKATDLGFTPGPGHQMQWAPKPDPGPINTNPSGNQPPVHQPPTQTGGGGGEDGSGGAGGGTGSGGGGGGGYSGGGHHGGGGGGGGGGDDGSGGGGGAGNDAPSGPPPPGNVSDWIHQAIEQMRAAGVPVSDADIPNIWAIIQHESGGNPHAINLWDSNAQAGHPSKGLMQCIDSTFNAHKLPGHDDIYNPVDNIIAGVRYSIDRYGGLGNVPGIKSMSHGGHYQGY